MDNQSRYIWQQPDWPFWRHDLPALFPLLIEVSQAQGRLLGRLQDLGEAQRAEASLGVLTEDVLKTSEIEGESLDVRSVRSSLARRLGVGVGGVAPVDTGEGTGLDVPSLWKAWSRWCWTPRPTVMRS